MEPLFDCPDCGAPAAITRDRETTHIPREAGLIITTRHVDGEWCRTFRPYPHLEVNP